MSNRRASEIRRKRPKLSAIHPPLLWVTNSDSGFAFAAQTAAISGLA
jgi:hypothetical protein